MKKPSEVRRATNSSIQNKEDSSDNDNDGEEDVIDESMGFINNVQSHNKRIKGN